MIVIKNIEMTLDPASIRNALEQIRDIESRWKPAMQGLIDYLGEKGVEIARAELIFFDRPAFETGALSESIKYESRKGEGEINAGEGLTNAMGKPTNYAVFVEYGTGAYGADINEHGWGGWWYPAPYGWWTPKQGKHAGQPMAWTPGMAPRPFMQHTLNDLTDEAESNGGRIVAEYLRGERV